MRADAALLDHSWLKRWRFDVVAYHRMAEADILLEDDRVELIEGELIETDPISPLHAGTANDLNRLLITTIGDRAIVSIRNPVRLGGHSEPQPDVALLRPRSDYYGDSTPTPADVLLLIELADSSRRYDRTIKLPLYARHRVPEVWIIDLAAGAVEVHREPGGDGYSAASRAEAGATLEPALLPGLRLAVADFVR